VLVVACGNTLRATVPEARLLALRLVTAEPLPERVPEKVPPEKVVAVIVPAEKLPDPSRLTIVEATLALVAVLERLFTEAMPELNVFQSVLDKYPLVLVVAWGNRLRGTVPDVKLLALRLVTAAPLPESVPEKIPPVNVPPEKVVAVIVPAEKFPAASRLTIVEATFAAVAVLEILVMEAMPELNVFQSVLDRYPLVLVVA
jgi:hypothetical protein